MKKSLLFSLITFFCFCTAFSQRKYQALDRGVVAVNNNSNVFVSWRLLLEDEEDCLFNLYVQKKGSGNYEKLTSTPQRACCFSTNTSAVPSGSLLAVTSLVNGKESEKSLPFEFKQRNYRSLFVEIDYDDFLNKADYSTKFIWPADLDGDGEYDFVVDRISLDESRQSSKVEGYLRNGKRLWTIDMGPNVSICTGHNDMVVAYDMNCDGRSEIVIKSSDGTRFWNAETKTWGNYLLNSANGDTDNDGIIDYNTQNVKNPPQYITVVDGMTGAELNTIEMPYPSTSNHTYTRTNKSFYMGGDRNGYNTLSGHMGIAYLDGIHPSVVMEYCCRTNDSRFHFYYVTAWGYEFNNEKAGRWVQQYHWNRDYQDCAEFHHIRIADVDQDGKDEMLDGGYTLDHDGRLLFSAHISHGDRFRTGDIDPDRPGLETFAIQQNANDMLGQILYDARTGKAIKKWYLSAVGDVGRGECIDIMPQYKGYEMWSTMGNIYTSKGELAYSGSVDMPKEGIWWDGELDREILDAPDGNGANAMITKYGGNGSYKYNRLIEIAKMMNWIVAAEYGCRPAFFGDIYGDWREEVLLEKREGDINTGFCGFTTDYSTGTRIHCLMQNAAYRMQASTRGYYQSAYPDYYLGYDMPVPPLAPFVRTDLVWKGGDNWSTGSSAFVNYTGERISYADSCSLMFDLSGDNTQAIEIKGTVSPKRLFVMAPEGYDYCFAGDGHIGGNTEVWKSQNGRMVLNGSHNYTGKTIISEGCLELNGSLEGPVEVRALGTLAGNATLNGTLSVSSGLHYQGGRLAPGNSTQLFGKITINNDFSLTKDSYIEMDLSTALGQSDTLIVNGDFQIEGNNYISILCQEKDLLPGEYPLIQWTGVFSGDIQHFHIRGLAGISKALFIRDKTLYLEIRGMRESGSIVWNGRSSTLWNFDSPNFSMDGSDVRFVNGDSILFDDAAENKTISLTEAVNIGQINIDNTETYTFNTNGGYLSGSGGIIKNGKGLLKLNIGKNNYTGQTVINQGCIEVSSIGDASTTGAFGNSSRAIAIRDSAKLRLNGDNISTERGLTLSGYAQLEVSRSAATIKGIISGTGQLIKSGNGQLNITYNGANTYTGGTELNGGTLAMGTWNTSFGKTGTNIRVTKNSTLSIFNNNSTSAVPNFNHNIIVPEGITLYFNAGQRCKINGQLNGSGIVYYNVPYVRADNIGNWSNFAGTLKVSGNQFRLCNNNGLRNASVVLTGSVLMGHFQGGSGNALSGGNSAIGALAGESGSSVGNGSYSVGYNNKDAIFHGTLSGVAITKEGSGVWTLSNGSNTCTSVSLKGGTLKLTNISGSATGTATINIYGNHSLLCGTGSLSGSVNVNDSAKVGGTLSIGGTLKLKEQSSLIVSDKASYTTGIFRAQNITMLDNSSLHIDITSGYSMDYDKLIVGNKFTPGGKLIVNKVSTLDFKRAADLKIIDAGSIADTRFAEIVLPELPENYHWDTTALYTEGLLRIVETSALNDVRYSDKLLQINRIDQNEYQVLIGTNSRNALFLVYDTKGKLLFRKETMGKNALRIHLNHQAAGTYIGVLQDAEKKYTCKFIHL